ncbi:MAG: toll/interleukin-1 receptor domain-containing protein [Verrucomicrobia bacterium]|nr:MAG: toll/interleukin-1 receptor domain-containing protein [Verrucomicrobiota bacterium]
MLFLSHALPEDNEFTRWLALRLAREGYPVWCDLTKLLGGEDFWSDIEEAIRNRTTKFLFVLSRTSNEKPGVLQELALAKRVGKGREDFVIPLKIDNLASDETTIELTRLNSIDFRGGWVAGLAKLLEKLEKDGVPKDPRFNAAAVATWWQDNLYSGQAVIARSEPQACNLFPIRSLPQRIFLHSLLGEKKKPDPLPLGYPSHRFGAGVFSFQTPRELIQALEPMGITVEES